MECVLSKFHCLINTRVENNFPQILWQQDSIDGKHIFHDFCGKMNSTEFVENKFAMEFGFPVVNDFTLIHFFSKKSSMIETNFLEIQRMYRKFTIEILIRSRRFLVTAKFS